MFLSLEANGYCVSYRIELDQLVTEVSKSCSSRYYLCGECGSEFVPSVDAGIEFLKGETNSLVVGAFNLVREADGEGVRYWLFSTRDSIYLSIDNALAYTIESSYHVLARICNGGPVSDQAYV